MTQMVQALLMVPGLMFDDDLYADQVAGLSDDR